MPKAIITGDWDGIPIWRWETAEDRLQKEIHAMHMDLMDKEMNGYCSKCRSTNCQCYENNQELYE